MSPSPSRIEQMRALIADYSEKAAAAFSEAAPQVLPIINDEAAQRWVEMGCALARESSAGAIKYFRESPEIIRAFGDQTAIPRALEVGLRLAGQDYGVSLEYFRQCPQVLLKIGPDGLDEWARTAAELATQDYATAIEYLKSGPEILDQLPLSGLSIWAQLGLILSQQDLKSKDFLALEYYRLSPEILGQVPDRELRPVILATALALAKSSSKLAMAFLRECPSVLAALDSYQAQTASLSAARDLAEVAPAAVPDLMSHCGQALVLADGSVDRFAEWSRRGVEMARANPERAGAYYALRLKTSHDHLRQLTTGIFLKDISRMLRLYAEALCGKSVEIRAAAGSAGLPTTPEGVITLPDKITLFASPQDNHRFYKVMTFHEAGHLEFRSHDPISQELAAELQGEAAEALHRALRDRQELGQAGLSVPVSALLDYFEDPSLAKSLWMILEEARIDFLLRHEYAGIQKDMDFVVDAQVRGRPPIAELSPRQGILESLLQLSVADSAEVPLGIVEVVNSGYAVLKGLRHPGATVNDSFQAVGALYPIVKSHLSGLKEETRPESRQSPDPNEGAEPLAMGHGPLENLGYRNPLPTDPGGTSAGKKASEAQGSPISPPEVSVPQQQSEPPSRRDALHAPTVPDPDQPAGRDIYYYDEWDLSAGDYRAHWCRIEEKPLHEDCPEPAARIQSESSSMISLLRRYFEYLRPEAFKKMKKQAYGEEVDLDSATQSLVERRAGCTPTDRIYILRQKKTRDVSVAFLIDMSGSTTQQIVQTPRNLAAPAERKRASQKRVIDVEIEGLYLLSEALDAVGDEFALYGFSGHSRSQINIYRIKDFDEQYGAAVQRRFGAIEPLGQNRDGAAIRHVTVRLAARPSRVKLLILLSDGKPLDEDYQGLHALEDTRMALREARVRGIHPFCITVDPHAGEYVQEMYGEVSYTIIDHAGALPDQLPRIYKRLTT